MNATTAVLHERFDAERVARDARGGRGHARLAGADAARGACATRAASGARPARDRCSAAGPSRQTCSSGRAGTGMPVTPTYGMTETTSQVAVTEASRRARRCAASSCAIAADGEILVRGPMVAPGRCRGDGWLHTGDRGRHRRGRPPAPSRGGSTDLIVTGGENVAPGGSSRRRCSRTRPSRTPAVVGRARPGVGRGGDRLRGAARAATDPEDCCASACRARLAGYKVPKRVVRGRRAAAQRRRESSCGRACAAAISPSHSPR